MRVYDPLSLELAAAEKKYAFKHMRHVNGRLLKVGDEVRVKCITGGGEAGSASSDLGPGVLIHVPPLIIFKPCSRRAPS